MFRDRPHAGRVLAARLRRYAGRPDVLVLALPRGGVPVGYEVAQALGAPLDLFMVRKLGLPGHEELAMGAIASGGIRILNEQVTGWLNISQSTIDEVTAREQQELERRAVAYRGKTPPPEIQDRTVILVDDGLATGSTMRAGVIALRQQSPAAIIVGVPVGAAQTCSELREIAD